MSSKTEKFEEQVRQFKEIELPRYKVYAGVLRELFALATQSIAPQAIVQVRTKSVPSFAEKILRKGYEDPFVQMTDLCGARIITHTKAEIDRFCEFIRECCEIDEAKSTDLTSMFLLTKLGYRSRHFVIYIPRSGWRDKGKISIPVPDSVYDLKAEVQVRTIAQPARSAPRRST